MSGVMVATLLTAGASLSLAASIACLSSVALCALLSPSDAAAPTADPIDTGLACPICFDVLVEPVTMSCQHSVCKGCLRRLIDATPEWESVRCPSCRSPLTREVPAGVNTMLQAQVETRHPAELAERRASERAGGGSRVTLWEMVGQRLAPGPGLGFLGATLGYILLFCYFTIIFVATPLLVSVRYSEVWVEPRSGMAWARSFLLQLCTCACALCPLRDRWSTVFAVASCRLFAGLGGSTSALLGPAGLFATLTLLRWLPPTKGILGKAGADATAAVGIAVALTISTAHAVATQPLGQADPWLPPSAFLAVAILQRFGDPLEAHTIGGGAVHLLLAADALLLLWAMEEPPLWLVNLLVLPVAFFLAIWPAPGCEFVGCTSGQPTEIIMALLLGASTLTALAMALLQWPQVSWQSSVPLAWCAWGYLSQVRLCGAWVDPLWKRLFYALQLVAPIGNIALSVWQDTRVAEVSFWGAAASILMLSHAVDRSPVPLYMPARVRAAADLSQATGNAMIAWQLLATLPSLCVLWTAAQSL